MGHRCPLWPGPASPGCWVGTELMSGVGQMPSTGPRWPHQEPRPDAPAEGAGALIDWREEGRAPGPPGTTRSVLSPGGSSGSGASGWTWCSMAACRPSGAAGSSCTRPPAASSGARGWRGRTPSARRGLGVRGEVGGEMRGPRGSGFAGLAGVGGSVVTVELEVGGKPVVAWGARPRAQGRPTSPSPRVAVWPSREPGGEAGCPSTPRGAPGTPGPAQPREHRLRLFPRGWHAALPPE